MEHTMTTYTTLIDDAQISAPESLEIRAGLISVVSKLRVRSRRTLSSAGSRRLPNLVRLLESVIPPIYRIVERAHAKPAVRA
jgi:hypothetical protein